MSPIAGLDAATMPAGMAEDMAKEAGIPEPNIALVFLECVIRLLETEGDVELVDKATAADLRTAASFNEGKRNMVKQCVTMCGQPAFRIMFKDFDTDQPRVPCAAVAGHVCGGV